MSMDKAGRYKNGAMQKFDLIKKTENLKIKEATNISESCIQEVAEQRCGGLDRLRTAISRGAVKVHMQGGVEMFSFPSQDTRFSDKISQSLSSSAQTPITESMHQQIGDCHGIRDHPKTITQKQ